MKVFYTAPYSGKQTYQKYYDKIREIIESNKVDLISPEKGNYKDILDSEFLANEQADRKIHYEAIKRGIEWADIVIIEITKESFQIGHEATLAILNKKPVLCLSLTEDWSIKIQNPYFFAAKYSIYNVREIVTNFIKKHQNEPLSERFNLFLSKTHLNHLENKAKKYKINMSEYLRRLIDNDK